MRGKFLGVRKVTKKERGTEKFTPNLMFSFFHVRIRERTFTTQILRTIETQIAKFILVCKHPKTNTSQATINGWSLLRNILVVREVEVIYLITQKSFRRCRHSSRNKTDES